MKITFLGTGTSTGVPQVGCQCEVCRSTDPRDNRLRQSVIIDTEDSRILIDCGPDFREQCLRVPFKRIDAVLLTHMHSDHVAGIDDLRPFSVFGEVDIYAEDYCATDIEHRLPYCFKAVKYPGVPQINMHRVGLHKSFKIGSIEIIPFRVMHGKLPILAFRIGKIAYITDMKTIEDSELEYLKGIELLVVNGLRWTNPHGSHQTIEEAVAFAQRVGAKQCRIVHLSHSAGLQSDSESRLPDNIRFAYDGEKIDV